MVEGLKAVRPWQQPIRYIRFLTSINLFMPFLDTAYTFALIPGLVLAMFGIFWIIGPMTLLVLPLAMLQNYILFVYQLVMSPISIISYVQEVFAKERVWK